MVHQVSARARADLDRIWDYLHAESGSETVADRQIFAITKRFYLLADYPSVGRARDDELGQGRRSFAINRFVIVYSIDHGDVLILRVAGAGQDIKALLSV